MPTTKRTFEYLLALFCLLLLRETARSQPFLFRLDEANNSIIEVNLSNNVNSVFLWVDSSYSSCVPHSVSWDASQRWVYFEYEREKEGITYIDVISSTDVNIRHTFPITGSFGTTGSSDSPTGRRIYDGLFFDGMSNRLYVSSFEERDTVGNDWSAGLQTRVYDASTFSCVDSINGEVFVVTSTTSISKDGSILYGEEWDNTYSTSALCSYSTSASSIVRSKSVSEIPPASNTKVLYDNKANLYLLGYNTSGTDSGDRYLVYNLEKDRVIADFGFRGVSSARLSADSKYVVVEETPVNPSSTRGSDFYLHPGKVSVFNCATGALVQNMQFPPNGTLVIFDNYPKMVYYYLPSEQRAIATDLSSLGGAVGLTVEFLDSRGMALGGGTLQYYEGTWKDAANNGDGTFTVNTSQSTVSLRMTYAYGSQQKNNVPVNGGPVTFQTVNTQVKLQNSQGVAIDTGSVQYYAGAWRSFGTTSNGVATMELLPANYSFRMTYAYGSNDKQQDIGANPVVVFQTVNASVQLKNSGGTLMDAGAVQYYAGSWRDFGSTTNGIVTKELLPNSYSFRMTYAYANKDMQQNIGTNPTVAFNTVNAAVELRNSLGNLIDQGTVQYYAGAWRSFGTTTNGTATKELLANNYSFRMTYEYVSNDKSQDIGTNSTVGFSTVLCTVRATNATGQLVSGAVVSYYSGAWRQIGSTANGEITKELLPANLSFRMSYGGKSQDKQQNLTTNPVVEFVAQ